MSKESLPVNTLDRKRPDELEQIAPESTAAEASDIDAIQAREEYNAAFAAAAVDDKRGIEIIMQELQNKSKILDQEDAISFEQIRNGLASFSVTGNFKVDFKTLNSLNFWPHKEKIVTSDAKINISSLQYNQRFYAEQIAEWATDKHDQELVESLGTTNVPMRIFWREIAPLYLKATTEVIDQYKDQNPRAEITPLESGRNVAGNEAKAAYQIAMDNSIANDGRGIEGALHELELKSNQKDIQDVRRYEEIVTGLENFRITGDFQADFIALNNRDLWPLPEVGLVSDTPLNMSSLQYNQKFYAEQIAEWATDEHREMVLKELGTINLPMQRFWTEVAPRYFKVLTEVIEHYNK